MTDATLNFVISEPGPLPGSESFFDSAAAMLKKSTKEQRELAGAASARKTDGGLVLEGLELKRTGMEKGVAVQSDWGSVNWHTHPGLKGSLAAFSQADLDAAKATERPLLVIGYSGLSPEVLSMLALALGKRTPLLIGGSVLGMMYLERHGFVNTPLLALGVAARICYPDGSIHPVARDGAGLTRKKLDELGFFLDKSAGSLGRKVQSWFSL